MAEAKQVTFVAKALRREDGRYDPCVEAVVKFDNGSRDIETSVVGPPKALQNAALEEAIRYLRRK